MTFCSMLAYRNVYLFLLHNLYMKLRNSQVIAKCLSVVLYKKQSNKKFIRTDFEKNEIH